MRIVACFPTRIVRNKSPEYNTVLCQFPRCTPREACAMQRDLC